MNEAAVNEEFDKAGTPATPHSWRKLWHKSRGAPLANLANARTAIEHAPELKGLFCHQRFEFHLKPAD
jgi:hypothetical protein